MQELWAVLNWAPLFYAHASTDILFEHKSKHMHTEGIELRIIKVFEQNEKQKCRSSAVSNKYLSPTASLNIDAKRSATDK